MEEENKNIDIDEIEEGKLWLGSYDPENVDSLKWKRYYQNININGW